MNLEDREKQAFRSSLAWFPWALVVGFGVFAGFLWHAARTAESLARDVSKRSVVSAEEFAKRTTVLIEQNTQLLNQLVEVGAERTRLEIRVSALEAEKSRLSMRLNSAEARDPLDQVRAIAFASQPEAPKGAEVVAVWDAHRQAGMLDLSKLPAPDADKDYQLWILSPEATVPVSAGIVSTKVRQANFRAPRPLGQIAALTLSLEPKGGSERPRGPVLFVGKF